MVARLPIVAVVALGLPACLAATDASVPSADGPGIEVVVSPLQLPGVGEICYGVTVRNGASTPQVVWERTQATGNALCSRRFGNGAGGDISYVGPCDAQEENHTVALVVESVTGADGVALTAGTDWVNPCTTTSPCVLPVECQENADTPVTFNLTIMRRALQGFFDVAVNFDAIFCSAKLDCTYDEAGQEPINLLFNEDGNRDQTVVAAVACTAGPGNGGTELHLNDIRVVCGDGENDNETFRFMGQVPMACSRSGDFEYMFTAGAALAMNSEVIGSVAAGGFCYSRPINSNDPTPSPWTTCPINNADYDIAVPMRQVAQDVFIGAVTDLVPIADITWPDADNDWNGDDFPFDPTMFFEPIRPAVFTKNGAGFEVALGGVLPIPDITTFPKGLLPVSVISRPDDIKIIAISGLPITDEHDASYFFYRTTDLEGTLTGPVLIEKPTGAVACDLDQGVSAHIMHFACSYPWPDDVANPNNQTTYERPFLVNLDGPVADGKIPMVPIEPPTTPADFNDYGPSEFDNVKGVIVGSAWFQVWEWRIGDDTSGQTYAYKTTRYAFTPETHMLVRNDVAVKYRDGGSEVTLADNKSVVFNYSEFPRVADTDPDSHFNSGNVLVGNWSGPVSGPGFHAFVGIPHYVEPDVAAGGTNPGGWELRITGLVPGGGLYQTDDAISVRRNGVTWVLGDIPGTLTTPPQLAFYRVTTSPEGYPVLANTVTLPFPIDLEVAPFSPTPEDGPLVVVRSKTNFQPSQLLKTHIDGTLTFTTRLEILANEWDNDPSNPGTNIVVDELRYELQPVYRLTFVTETLTAAGFRIADVSSIPAAGGDDGGSLLGLVPLFGDSFGNITVPGAGCDWVPGLGLSEGNFDDGIDTVNILKIDTHAMPWAQDGGAPDGWSSTEGLVDDTMMTATESNTFQDLALLPLPVEISTIAAVEDIGGGANLLIPGGAAQEGNALGPNDPRDNPVFQYAYYHGTEALTCNGEPCNKVYASIAIGFDPDELVCNLRWEVTASQPGTFTGGATPEATSWPVIVYDVQLTGDGTTDNNLTCQQHPVNGLDSGVSTHYTPIGTTGFQLCWDFDGASFTSYCDADVDYSYVDMELFKKPRASGDTGGAVVEARPVDGGGGKSKTDTP